MFLRVELREQVSAVTATCLATSCAMGSQFDTAPDVFRIFLVCLYDMNVKYTSYANKNERTKDLMCF